MFRKIILFVNLVFNHGISPVTILKNRDCLNAAQVHKTKDYNKL